MRSWLTRCRWLYWLQGSGSSASCWGLYVEENLEKLEITYFLWTSINAFELWNQRSLVLDVMSTRLPFYRLYILYNWSCTEIPLKLLFFLRYNLPPTFKSFYAVSPIVEFSKCFTFQRKIPNNLLFFSFKIAQQPISSRRIYNRTKAKVYLQFHCSALTTKMQPPKAIREFRRIPRLTRQRTKEF